MHDEFLRDEILDRSILDLGPRDAAQALLRAQLEAHAERKQLASDAFRARLRVARQAGIPVVDLLRRTGAARQTVYDAFNAPIGRELDDLSVLALIASGAAQTAEALVEVTGSEPGRIGRVLSSLRSACATSFAERRVGAVPASSMTSSVRGVSPPPRLTLASSECIVVAWTPAISRSCRAARAVGAAPRTCHPARR
jgi:hypothetical protein